MKRIAFIVHGKSKNKELLYEQIFKHFANSFHTQIFETEHYQHTIELARTAAANQTDCLICCGGDGSLNEALNGIMQSGNTQIQLGVLPFGSGNDFIKTIQAPNSVEKLRELIDNNQYQTIDIGLAHYTDPNHQATSRYFINITDLGIGGVVAQQIFGSKKLFGPTITYQYYILKNLLTYKTKMVNIQADTFTYTGRVMNFVIANGRYFGSGMGVSPFSSASDGLLNAIAIGNIRLTDYFKYLPTIKKCQPIEHPEVKYFTASKFECTAPDGPLPIDMDGEFVGFLPLRISVIPQAIKFIA